MKLWKFSVAGLGLLTVGLCLSEVQKVHADSNKSDDNVELLTGNDKFGAVISKDGQASSVIVNQADLQKVINAVGDPSKVADDITASSSLAAAKSNAKSQFNAYANKFKSYVKGQKLSADDTKTLDAEIDRVVAVTDSQIDHATSMDQINTVIENGLYGSSIVSAGETVKQDTNLDSVKNKIGDGSKEVANNNGQQNGTSDIKNQLANNDTANDGDNNNANNGGGNSNADSQSNSTSQSQDHSSSTDTNSNNAGNAGKGGNSTGTSNSGSNSVNTQKGFTQQTSSNVSNQRNFSSVDELEKYADENGDASVNGATVQTPVNEILTNQNKSKKGATKTDFYGDKGVEFSSTNYFDIKPGDTVTVTVINYFPGDDDQAASVEFSNLTKPGQDGTNGGGANGNSTTNGANGGGSSQGQGQQPGNSGANGQGQNGNGTNGSGNAANQGALPQTGASLAQNNLVTVGGLMSLLAAVAGGTLLKRRKED